MTPSLVLALTLASAAPPPSAALRPILVSIDDLPIAATALHPKPEDRAALTRAILAVLAKHHVPAVGLVTWSHVTSPADRALLERWLDAGHELGNHSASHLDYSRTSFEAYRADVEQGRAALAALLAPRSKVVRFFRFPFLDEGETPQKLAAMRRYLTESGQRSLPVTIDDQDWSFEEEYVGDRSRRAQLSADYQAMMREAVRHHEARGDRLFKRPVPQILLLHAGAVGAGEWDQLFTWLERSGHRFASVNEVLANPAFATEHEFVGENGPGLWDRILDGRRRAEVKETIARLLAEQAAAWNRGDIPAFTAAYADDATFISPSGRTEGRAAIADRYAKKYDSREKMGALTLEVLETRLAVGMEFSTWGDARPSRVHGASTILRWTIAFPGQAPATGLSLITLAPRPASDGAWMIVQDASM